MSERRMNGFVCRAHDEKDCALCEELSLASAPDEFEPCGAATRVEHTCQLPGGHKGNHVSPTSYGLEVWERDAPLVAGGQGRDADEIAHVGWVGVILLVIVSGFVGALIFAAAQAVAS